MTDLQKVIYDIFLDVAKTLKENNIDYYAIGGTCLGAIRHQGFIPWDDDIDIAVKIEDYDKAIEVLRNNLPSHYTVRFIDTNSCYPNIFFKVVDERTTCIERIEFGTPEAYKGCFVDVMPLSGVPDNDFLRKIFCYKINIYRILHEMQTLGKTVLDLEWKKKLYPVLKPCLKRLPACFFGKKWYNMLKRYPFETSNYTGYVWFYDAKSLIYRTEVFGKPVPLKFESTEMLCPEDSHSFLELLFGDYMALPPEDQQVPIHVGLVDLEHSYHDYAKGKYTLVREK